MPYLEQRTNLISTDIIGLRMDPDEMMELHDLQTIMHDRYHQMVDYFKQLFHGVEAFPLLNIDLFNRFITSMEERQFPVISLHGRTGGHGYNWIDTQFLRACNQLIIDTPTLLESYKGKFELLFHIPELEDQKNMNEIQKHGSSISFIWVENHHSKKSLDAAINKVRELRRLGIPSAVMFDICHYIGAKHLGTHSFNQEYAKAIAELEPIFAQTDEYGIGLIQGIHLAVGRKVQDSLPILEMSEQQLSHIASLIHQNQVKRLVLEHQEGGLLSTIAIPEKTIPMLQQRHAQIIDRLMQTNIL